METTERYYSVRELAEKGLASESTLKRMIKSGKLQSYKFGRSRKIAESDLNQCLKLGQSAIISSNNPAAQLST